MIPIHSMNQMQKTMKQPDPMRDDGDRVNIPTLAHDKDVGAKTDDDGTS